MMNKNEKRHSVVTSTNTQKNKRGKSAIIIPAILSLLLAFALWFYVISVESPTYTKEYSSVPISVVQGRGTLSPYPPSSEWTVDITVSGKKSVLNQISVSDFDVTADISKYTEAGKQNVPLSFSIPEGATKVKSSIDSLSLYLDTSTSKKVPITVNVVDYTHDDEYEIGEGDSITKEANDIPVSEVTVSGPATVLEKIESALVTASLGGAHVEESKTVSSSITLVDAHGEEVTSPYITTDISNIKVRIPVYMTRTLPLTVAYKYGYFDSSNVDVKLSPSSVSVRGEADVIKFLDSISVTTIDEKTANEGKKTTTLVVPDGVTVQDGTTSVDVTIKFTDIMTKTVAVTNITVKQPEGGVYFPSQETLRVTLRGPSDMIEEIAAEDVSAVVDLSKSSPDQNNITKPAEIVISPSYSTGVYEVGEYSVSLTRE